MNFIAIVFVVFIHSPYTEAVGHPLAISVQAAVTGSGLGLFAVPLFFAMSGLLFFKNVQRWNDCFPKIGKRINTLLVPYVLWNLVFVGWYALMGLLPGLEQYVNSNVFDQLCHARPLVALQRLFIDPAGFHLWFLRDLMLYIILSPLLYIGIRRYAWLLFLLSVICLGWIPRQGFSYFVLGGIISVHYSLENVEHWLNRKVSLVMFVLYLFNALAAALGLFCFQGVVYQYYLHIMGFVAIMAVWGVYDVMFSQCQSRFLLKSSPWMSYTFFIYLFHEPAFNIIKKLGLKMLGVHDWSLIVLFIVNPFIMVGFAIGVGMAFKHCLPKVYALSVGGR